MLKFQGDDFLHAFCGQLGIKKEVNMANIMRRNNGGTMTRTNPASFGGFVDDILQNTLTKFFDDNLWTGNQGWLNSQVPVNVRETDNNYELEVVAPGLRKENFNVNMHDNMLTVSFEHKQEDNEENKDRGYLRHEYRTQSFSRSFTIDDSVSADKITAEYKDGVLHISLPKKEGAQKISKNIEIK
jgi:HSP20 family protein